MNFEESKTINKRQEKMKDELNLEKGEIIKERQEKMKNVLADCTHIHE